MKVLIYDVDVQSSGVKYPIKSALEAMGHEATMFDWSVYFKSNHNFSFFDKLKRKIFFKIVEININRDIQKIISKNHFDLFLVMRGDYLYPETIQYSKTKINKIVNWNTDDLFNKLNSSNLIIQSLKYYDIHFSPRISLRDEYMDKGALSVYKLDWYYRYGLDYNKYSSVRNLYLRDSAFIGSWSERRHMLLTSLNDYNLDIFGWGWKKEIDVLLYKNWKISNGLSILQMQDEFYNSKVNINILTIENRDTTNLRNFEIPASGGFQLSERSNEILELFEEDKEIVCFSDKDELLDKYKYYIKNDSIREKIANEGRKKVFKSNNSLIDRLEQIINLVKI